MTTLLCRRRRHWFLCQSFREEERLSEDYDLERYAYQYNDQYGHEYCEH